jgi:5-methylcytosine-specific restriction endonuclease McrA
MKAPRFENLATPLSPGRYRLQVTIGQKARDALVELQSLLSHQIPDGGLSPLIERALKALLEQIKKKKAALFRKPRRPRPGRRAQERRTRTIPAQVRREVFERDRGRCAFVSAEGKRCDCAWQLEFHHCVSYARDGPHSAQNIELRCRAHNQYEAELELGTGFMDARRWRSAW